MKSLLVVGGQKYALAIFVLMSDTCAVNESVLDDAEARSTKNLHC